METKMFYVTPGGEYKSPEISVFEVQVEKGFAASPGNEGVGEEGGLGGFN